MQTFKQRSLTVKFDMTSGTFADGTSTTTLTGMRVSARIEYHNRLVNYAQIQIYGLSKELLKKLTFINNSVWPNAFQPNIVSLQYTDDTTVTVFSGGIVSAIVDYNSAPDVPLIINASSSFGNQMHMTQSFTFPGTVSVSAIFATLAESKNETVRDFGVDTVLTDESVNGSYQDMLNTVARDANIDIYRLNSDTFGIFPKGKGNEIDPMIEVNTENGMVGWPLLNEHGCVLRTLYSPNYEPYKKVNVTCSDVFDQPQKFWIESVVHQLDSEMPNGQWFTQLSLLLIKEEAAEATTTEETKTEETTSSETGNTGNTGDSGGTGGTGTESSGTGSETGNTGDTGGTNS